jgi:hypothetical protein
MKKVLALSLVFALFVISATAQNPKTEQLRKQRMELRMQHRGQQFRHPGVMKNRHELMRHRIMKQRMMRQHAVPQRKRMELRQNQMQQHRRMMLRRHMMNRRVI